ncbi:restriction endonuclease [Leptospira interrogans serovar Copenhageni]|nr:restriction endonuclease [Leptospira interrogans serovar Bratislava]ARB96795.1 restriction endonuclease [Leptospira interrogans serovar Copenhageni]ASP41646.1 restriction endonuclease [Leptospira interrogans]QOI45981.1 restriction endonuclease [Leptospira interrogans serovar Icterohaemorrhagiae]KAA5549986.1 restriction endonuclease [Leptospira interrogans serovar Copenhageni]
MNQNKIESMTVERIENIFLSPFFVYGFIVTSNEISKLIWV